MSAFFSQVFALLTSPPGNLVYQLVLVFSIAGALQSALIQWRGGDSPERRRTALGLGLLLAIQILLFALGSLSWGGGLNAASSLPPLDRAATLVSVVWIIWLWVFPEKSAQGDAGAVLLSAFAAAAAGLSLLTWPARGSGIGYNHSVDDLLWQAASIAVIVFGGFLLVVRRSAGYANGLAMLAVLFLGHALHLLVPESGNFSGLLRLAYIAAFPILLTLPQRAAASTIASPPVSEAPAQEGQPEGAESRRYGADPKTIHALFGLAGESAPLRLNQSLARAIAHTMLSDLCFLVELSSDRNEMSISSGYDLIREDYLPGTSLNKAAIPRIANAIQRARPLRLPGSGTSADLKGLSEIVGLTNPGNVLVAPIVTPENESIGGVILLSPYSQRAWSAEDQAFLSSIAAALVHVLRRGQKAAELERSGDDLKKALSESDDRLARAEARADEVTRQLETLALEAQQTATLESDLDSLRASHEQSQNLVEQLRQELTAERAQGKSSDGQVERALNASLRDVARLQNELAESNQKLLDQQNSGGERRKREQAEVIASISQELRQPMSSIIGYTDLLLGESVGLLGALQRKFIERIKAGTERIGSLIDDMIQLNTLEVGLSDLKPEAMDLNLIIDNALAYTGGQVREKKISMHLDVPKHVAPVNADREALQQILIHLLQNAGAATPVEGAIRLKVQTTQDEGRASVLIQVADSGGGIPPEDLPRVFTRLYRADNVLIQGVGDTGVGLSIAKTLTEAQHGRIWVESEPGTGATFNVLLPAVRDSVDMPRKETS